MLLRALLISLQLLLSAALVPAQQQCNDTAIPPPFGILDGFDIQCNTVNDEITNLTEIYPQLPLPGGESLRVLEINITDGYVRVQMPAVASFCSPRASLVSLEGTPFTFSHTANKLTVVGCDALVLLNGSRPGQRPSGCASFCYSLTDVNDNGGLCSGVGCCEAPIPSGLKSFQIHLSSIRNVTAGVLDLNDPSSTSCGPHPGQLNTINVLNQTDDHDHQRKIVFDKNLTGSCHMETCSKAFIMADDPWFKFLSEEPLNIYRKDLAQVVLIWSIGNMTCEEARKDLSTFACTANSYCYDSPNGIGYRCNCSSGYAGNPYLRGGCQDIDECLNKEQHSCFGYCYNQAGSFNCSCPAGTYGYPYSEGHCFPLPIQGSEGRHGIGSILIIIMSIGGSTLLVFCGGILLTRTVKERNSRKRKRKCFIRNHGMLLEQMLHSDTTLIERMKLYTIAELEKATNNFDATRVVGGGGHGTVYKGILSDQRVVAIKRSKISNRYEIDQFINEMILLSQVNHRNVVKLYGCCLETEVPLLVFEFVSGGTLSKHLQARNGISILSLEDRVRIAIEVAGALVYLHTYSTTSILHRDVKSSNILLDEWCHAKVSDFGASRSVPHNQDCITTAVQGTFGYLDPEYFHTRHVTEKSDVYSFGVILVELLTGMTVATFNNSEGQSLSMHFINSMQQGHLSSVVDAEIVEAGQAEDIESIARIAAACLRLKGEERPAMKEVERKLDRIRRHRKQRDGSIALEQKDFQVYSHGGSSTKSSYSDASRQYSMEREFLLSYRSPR